MWYNLVMETEELGCMVMETGLAYIAGMLDGEGYISIRTYRTHRGSQSYGNKVNISNTCYDVILHMQSIIITIDPMLAGHVWTSPYRPDRKTMYKVEWSGDNAANILKLLLPYLVIKKEAAELVIAFRSEVNAKEGRTRVLTEADHIVRQYYLNAIADTHIRR